MVKKLQLMATAILLSTVCTKSFTVTGILQQVNPEKCIVCIEKLVFDLEYIQSILNKTYSTGTITIKNIQKPSLLDQLTSKQDKCCGCKQNCKRFSVYKKTRNSIEKLTNHEALLKAYNSVYWYVKCQEGLETLTTGLTKLTYINRIKDVKKIEQDIKRYKEVVLNPDLKSEIKRNIVLVEAAINQLKTEKF